MHVIITCEYEKDQIKNQQRKSGNIDFFKCSRAGNSVVRGWIWPNFGKSGNIEFLDAQGQVTLWSGVGSGRFSDSAKLLCMSLLPESMKRIR